MGRREPEAEVHVEDHAACQPSAGLSMEALKIRSADWENRGKYSSGSEAAEQLGLPPDHPEVWRQIMAECGLLDQYEAELTELKERG